MKVETGQKESNKGRGPVTLVSVVDGPVADGVSVLGVKGSRDERSPVPGRAPPSVRGSWLRLTLGGPEVPGPEVVAPTAPATSVEVEEIGPAPGTSGVTPRRLPPGLGQPLPSGRGWTWWGRGVPSRVSRTPPRTYPTSAQENALVRDEVDLGLHDGGQRPLCRTAGERSSCHTWRLYGRYSSDGNGTSYAQSASASSESYLVFHGPAFKEQNTRLYRES